MEPPPPLLRFNFKKGNWKKFNKLIKLPTTQNEPKEAKTEIYSKTENQMLEPAKNASKSKKGRKDKQVIHGGIGNALKHIRPKTRP